MTPNELHWIISRMPDREPFTAKLEKMIMLRRPGRFIWYKSQKEHWLGWLKDYKGKGYYKRTNWKRNAEFIYNHLQCSPMLLWLGEALGVPDLLLHKASEAAKKAGKNDASQCAALRREIPWNIIEEAMKKRNLI